MPKLRQTLPQDASAESLGQLVVRRTLAVDNLSFERSAVSLGRDDDVAGPLQLDGGQARVLEQRLAHLRRLP